MISQLMYNLISTERISQKYYIDYNVELLVGIFH